MDRSHILSVRPSWFILPGAFSNNAFPPYVVPSNRLLNKTGELLFSFILIGSAPPALSEEKVIEAAEVAMEIIESVPIFLARAAQEARHRKMVKTVQPVLDHAEQYFLRPVDLIPEMTQGLAGLLDDTYLVLRVLQNLDRGPEPFLDWDLEYPVAFLRGLVGEEIGQKLDTLSVAALQDVSQHLHLLWEQASHEA